MPLALTLPARLRSALPGPAARRVAGWAAVVALLAAAAGALVAYTAAGVAPSPGTGALTGGAALAAGALLYALVGARAGTPADDAAPDPISLLWTRLLVVVGVLLAIEAAPAVFGTGAVDAGHLPADLLTAVAGIVYTVLHAVAAALLLRGLRPLVLARPTRAAVRTWRAFLGLTALAAVARLATPPGSDPSVVHFIAAAAVAVAMTATAFRQGWIVALPGRRRMAAGGLALLLAAALGLMMGESFAGPGAVPVEGPGGRATGADDVPYAFLLSPALGDALAITFAFGLLYGVTSALTLLFSLPTSGAYAQRAGEVRAFRALSALTLDPAQGLDRERLAAAVSRAPVEAGIARAAWVALADPARGTLAPVVVAAHGIAVADAARAADAAALAQDALAQRRPLALARAAADHRVRARPGDGVGSLLVLPLVAGGQSHGALFAARATPDAFDPDETAALEAFAAQAALALSHAALFSEAVEKERMARELALARDVQARLLPQRMPDVAGGRLAGRIRSAQEVCGDYYDVAELGGGCVGILVADVAGKGAAAAFHMAQLKGIFQGVAALSRSPGAFLARANEALRPSLGPRSFVSAVYAVLDPTAGTLAVARAGHCPALLAREGRVWPLRAPGLGLGLDAGPLFRRTLVEQVVALRPGDVVALYTDGLVEARDAAGEEFGYDRLATALLATAATPERVPADAPDGATPDAERIRDGLVDALDAFADPAAAADDTTLVVLTWHGPPGAALPAADAPDAPPFTLRPAFPGSGGVGE